ncbi:MAG: peroxide stress protein YaaA [Deltaproteobacteria bacterium]|nr:peroxide stress protein YaaA [Deltaproteobacteria bacterium]
MTRNKSSILFLLICSNHKTRDGETREYQSIGTMRETLPDRAVHQLYTGREHIFDLITKSESISRDGKVLRQFPLNESLVPGLDIQLAGTRSQGLYLPAAKRYTGRFYSELGSDRVALLTNSPHHVLIVSGLYGLLTPVEPIQCYSCHVPDHPDIATRWTSEDLLSEVLVAYIERHRIGRVFDFMAVDAYRKLVSWERLRHTAKGTVLHCFSGQYAGEALLPSLGRLAKEMLVEPERTLFDIKVGDTRAVSDDKILFQPVPVPESPDIAREIERQEVRLTRADQIGRMRRNMNLFLSCALGWQYDRDGFRSRARRLGQRSKKDSLISRLMLNFADLRDLVEY